MFSAAQITPPALILPCLTIAIALALLFAGLCVRGRRQLLACRARFRASQAGARGALALRDSLIGAGSEAIAVWGPGAGQPLCFGSAQDLIEASLGGPDGKAVSAALAALRENGVGFTLAVRDSRNRPVAIRGCAVGGHAALFLQIGERGASLALDCLGALEAVPLPVWLRGPDLRLKWANHAFGLAMGAQSLQQAIEADFAFDRSERDLAASARESGCSIAAERYAFVSGQRRALSISAHPLADGTIVGIARNVVADSGAALVRQTSDALAHALDQLNTGVAIFGDDRRLIFANRSLARILQLDAKWLSRHPTQSEILDRLREQRQLPEQIDFAAWKRERDGIFNRSAKPVDELWHLPDGRGLRLVRQPVHSGGFVVFLDDVTDTLRLEAANNALLKVQKATLDTLQEGCAVFAPDGCLRAYNAAFARLWRLTDEELRQEPHINRIGELCASRTGQDGIWDIVACEVTSSSSERHKEWFRLARLDGRMLSLSLTRLPDGSTLASFADITDFCRLAPALRETAAVA